MHFLSFAEPIGRKASGCAFQLLAAGGLNQAPPDLAPAALALGGFGLLLGVVSIVIVVAWIILPFALFGLKRRLQEINDTLNRIGMTLEGRLPRQQRPGENVRIGRDDIFSFGDKR